MPIYKLHEAQQASTAFGGPATTTASDPTRMVIDPNAARPPTHQLHPSAPPPQQISSSAVPPHPGRILTAHSVPVHHQQQHPQHTQQLPPRQPPQQQYIQHIRQQPPPELQQHMAAAAAAPMVPGQPARSHVAKLENAHFGHSLYFIEHLFPSKLWRILDDAERCGYDNVISWVDNGTAFQIHDRENVIPILEKFFNMSKFKSFLRQLQAYGFQRVAPNPQDGISKPKKDSYRGKWNHPLFLRDKMNLCNKMTRDGSGKKEDKSKSTTNSGSGSPVHKEVAPPNPGPAGPPTSQSPTHPSAATQYQRINQSQVAIAQHHEKQKRLAAQQQQQQQLAVQQHRQQQMQLMHNRMVHHQHHHPHAPPSQPPGGAPVYHHSPRFGSSPHQHPPPGAHHTLQPPPGVRPPPLRVHHPAPPGAALPRTAAVPTPAGTPANTGINPTMLARAKQQQEERQRQHLQMQIQQIKGQQLLSSILGRPGEAVPVPAPGMAPPLPPPSAPISAPATNAQAPVDNHLLKGVVKGVNYNNPYIPSSTVSPPGSPATRAAADKAPGTVAAADDLRRAELALIERRRRLAEAQELAKSEAEAIAKAEAAVWAAQSSAAAARAKDPQAAARSSTAVAQELLLRKHPQIVIAPATATAPQQAPAAGDNAASAPEAAAGGLSITSLLADLDDAFKTSAIPPPPTWVAPASQIKDSPQTDSSGKSTTAASLETTVTNDQLRITDEELQRAKAEAASGPAPVDLRAQPVPTSGPNSTTAAASAVVSSPGKASPGPSASEREVILARLNAMEQIRLREQQQQKHETERIQGQQKRSKQRHQLLINFAKAELDGKPPVAPIPPPSASAASSTAVRDAIRNAAVGLISGGSSTTTTNDLLSSQIVAASSALGGVPPASTIPSGIVKRINPPTSVLPPVQAPKIPPRLLSKEMMDIFAKTAAAAISSKTTMDSSSSGSQTGVPLSGSNSHNSSPPPPVAGSASPIAKMITIPKPAQTSSAVGELVASIPGKTPAQSPPTQQTPATSTNPPLSASNVISNSELEAARALMRIPGTVTQPNGESLTGHWELVRPEELKKGAPLAKYLPQVVNKSADLSYEAYRNLALKMSPPNVMSIPQNWDARKEPVYLVVDPTNAVAASPAPTVSATMAMAINGGAQAAGPAAAFRATDLR